MLVLLPHRRRQASRCHFSARRPRLLAHSPDDRDHGCMWPRQVTALRPLGVGERMDVAIKIVRRNFLTFLKAALVVAVPATVVIALIAVTMLSSLQSIFT